MGKKKPPADPGRGASLICKWLALAQRLAKRCVVLTAPGSGWSAA